MLVSHEHEKLINAVVFFASDPAHCGSNTVIRRLYLLDFEHPARPAAASPRKACACSSRGHDRIPAMNSAAI